MFYVPPLRRMLLPSLVCLIFVILYHTAVVHLDSIAAFLPHTHVGPAGHRIHSKDFPKHTFLPYTNASSYEHVIPPSQYLSLIDEDGVTSRKRPWVESSLLQPLLACPSKPNKYTMHIRLQNGIRNITMSPSNWPLESRGFWNPTILALPYWSNNRYLLVSRVLTDGLSQQNVICEAKICGADDASICSDDDIEQVGLGGMRCVTEPQVLDVPATPAKKCAGKFEVYALIPGFHDPRIFWGGNGEPLMMLNTQSQYGCFGLWLIDLRSLYKPLTSLISSSPSSLSQGPLTSYPTLTELTRNPPSSRSTIEKNWIYFSPGHGASYLHYEISPSSRSFSKLVGNGLVTGNMTDPLESSCLNADFPDPDMETLMHDSGMDQSRMSGGTWHQATNSLRLILCARNDVMCRSRPASETELFVAIIHRKMSNGLKLPMRYERYFFLWSATAPFEAVAISRFPTLLANETASDFSAEENWEGDDPDYELKGNAEYLKSVEEGVDGKKDLSWYFTYTVSLAWAWRGEEKKVEAADMGTGYLDEDVIMGIGLNDEGQAFAKVKMAYLLGCLRRCPGKKEGQ
ncbi:hypothetical protein K402DRAFT_368276 [Aulographum hederae CBS 113979]|uniref:Uncharacterized protein n=1 Tax=Aulographum hederae CBS 113979 TaxID=1176131 RepID=A0A6G1HEX9_9PEZI|nr:hypothetical protein K402DRAFT_368276 [Aulographum hederae CBS 113979]